MELVADLHLHSKYSRAVSPQMIIPEMAKWAAIKGINLLGTGDFTHPIWLKELQTNLEEQNGILRPKTGEGVKFLLTTEISSIYSQGGKTRKIHSILIAPSFAVVEKINKELKSRGANLSSDGRPIVGLRAKDILQIILGVDDRCLLIPAHIWTPWFSLFGSKSGYDFIEECFGDLSKYIYGVETGISSDPGMNWRIKDLDGRSILSFSDAHSPGKLGREATVFEVNDIDKLRYEDFVKAIVKGEIKYTIEFYPEEGRYHYTGHRDCKVMYSPSDTAKKGTTCPVCGKPLTVGVMERVKKLGNMGEIGIEEQIDSLGVKWFKKQGRPKFAALVPLMEIIAENLEVGESSKKVIGEYFRLIKLLGSEFSILTKLKLEDIAKIGGAKLAEGIMKTRSGDIYIRPGYDGEYGKVKVWGEEGNEEKKKENKPLYSN